MLIFCRYTKFHLHRKHRNGQTLLRNQVLCHNLRASRWEKWNAKPEFPRQDGIQQLCEWQKAKTILFRCYFFFLWEKEATVVPVVWQAVAFNVAPAGGKSDNFKKEGWLEIIGATFVPILEGIFSWLFEFSIFSLIIHWLSLLTVVWLLSKWADNWGSATWRVFKHGSPGICRWYKSHCFHRNHRMVSRHPRNQIHT